jgi:hypothetical protein
MARKVHKIEAGEHISAIAARHSFMSFVPLWNASENAHLRAVREDPHQLLPGDEVVIPEKKPVEYPRPTDALYEFVVYVEKLQVRLKLVDLGGKPLAGVACKLASGGATEEATTDGDGIVAVPIPRDCTTGTLSAGKASYELAVGSLAPISDPSGQAARLMNLGYWYGDDDRWDDPDTLKLAIQLFQGDHDLEITGKADANFVAKLDQVHDGRG